MSKLRGYVTILRVVEVIKVCHSYEGLSQLSRYVTIVKVCHSNEGMSQLRRYVTITRVCHNKYVMKVCHSYECMSYSYWHVKVMRVCHDFVDLSKLCYIVPKKSFKKKTSQLSSNNKERKKTFLSISRAWVLTFRLSCQTPSRAN